MVMKQDYPISKVLSNSIYENRLKSSTQKTNVDESFWYGLAGAPMKTSISFNNSWEDNDIGTKRKIVLLLEENGFDKNDKLKINSLYFNLIISLDETYQEGNGKNFHKNDINFTIIPDISPIYTSILNVEYPGRASKVSFSLHINYDYYIYDSVYGSFWHRNLTKSSLCANFNTNDPPTISNPLDLDFNEGNIPIDANILWNINDNNDNLLSYEIYQNDYVVKKGNCLHTNSIEMSIDQDLKSGTYKYKLLVKDDLGSIRTDTVLVKIFLSISFGEIEFFLLFTIVSIGISVVLRSREKNVITEGT
jgi:hypothetical protein